MADKAITGMQHLLEIGALARKKETRFTLDTGTAERDMLKAALGLLSLRKLSFSGTITPIGQQDWSLSADLGATVQQPCVVSSEPVTTRIDAKVSRRFVANMPENTPDTDDIDEDGTPMLADDSLEPLGREINLMALVQEALALELPDYPRAEGAELGTAIYTEPGQEAMTDEAAKPFAGLANLRDKLSESE